MATIDLAQIRFRRGTASEWTVADTLLAGQEVGVETDTKLMKMGDGVTRWNALGYMPEQLAKQITSATSKPTPVGADELPIADSAATFGLKKLTLTNLAAWLASLVQTLTNKTLTNPIIDSPVLGFATQATAASTLILTVASKMVQEFTGSTAGQIVQMPVTSTLGIGQPWRISNKSTQTIAVNSSGGNLIFTVPAGTDWLFTCNAITGTTAASWSNSYAGASAVPSAGGIISGQVFVATAETTTSATYVGLTTAQAVTVTTGTKVLVLLNCAFEADNISNTADGFMSVAVSGATTTAASDANALYFRSVIASAVSIRGGIALYLTCTAGSNTFTAQFRNTGYTAKFSDRRLIVIDLGS